VGRAGGAGGRTASYLTRTEWNARDSDGTVIFTMGELSGGSKRTAEFAAKHRRPWLHLRLDGMTDKDAQEALRAFVEAHGVPLPQRRRVEGQQGA
jgi:hypothetical protein